MISLDIDGGRSMWGRIMLMSAAALALVSAVLAAPASGTPNDTSPDDTTPPTASEPYKGRVFAIGDSVMLGARDCLKDKGIKVDAVGSRSIAAGTEVLRNRAHLPRRVVVHLGTNGGAYPEDFDRLMRVLKDRTVVVVVTIQLPNDYSRYTFEKRTNKAIRALPKRYPNVRVVDWNRAAQAHLTTWFWGDEIHLPPRGCEAFADMVDAEVRR